MRNQSIPPKQCHKRHPWTWPSTAINLQAISQLFQIGETMISKGHDISEFQQIEKKNKDHTSVLSKKKRKKIRQTSQLQQEAIKHPEFTIG